jgi:hypothetical protein
MEKRQTRHPLDPRAVRAREPLRRQDAFVSNLVICQAETGFEK